MQTSRRHARSHSAILASAMRLLREHGMESVSLAQVMAGAGLTVGGFYAHFPSKEALFEQALDGASSSGNGLFARAIHGKRTDECALAVLHSYLSRRHRDEPADGCALPATVADVSRGALNLRPGLELALERFAQALAAYLPTPNARSAALALVALMYGGLSLSRAVGRGKLSDELLECCRELGVGVVHGIQSESKATARTGSKHAATRRAKGSRERSAGDARAGSAKRASVRKRTLT